MIGLDIPLSVMRGKCSSCKERIHQVLIPGNPRCWLKADPVYGGGDEGEPLCGYTEHQCPREQAA